LNKENKEKEALIRTSR